MSRAALGPKFSSMRRAISGMMTMAIGRLIQKIHCHARPCAKAPPTTGPAMSATPVTPLKIPSSRPRSSRERATPKNAKDIPLGGNPFSNGRAERRQFFAVCRKK
jgi:hypothetical protein